MYELIMTRVPAGTAKPSISSSASGARPNNHPGGYREITLLPGGIGAYRLANVHGGKGRGEPDSYDLPAIIIERPEVQQIIIDFSGPPKNGPRDFAGVWDANQGGIRFVRDGNFWPRVQS